MIAYYLKFYLSSWASSPDEPGIGAGVFGDVDARLV
jgi:hypothetical protein